MTSPNDPLDDLIHSARQRKKKSGPTSSSPGGRPEEKKALNPIDLLTLPADQRAVINYLSRQKQAHLKDIQAGVRTLTAGEVVEALKTLKESGYIREALLNGEIYYRVAFGGTTSRTKVYLPEEIWSSLNLDNLTFLERMPLFQQLPQDELKTLANELEARHYRRDEVIVWQDEPSDDAYLIKNGIVGISRLSAGKRQSQNLAYLKEGDILGEIGLLQDQVRSATATALSKVDVLVLERKRFLELLQKYDTAALALARMLGRQLVATSARLEQHDTPVRLILVFRVGAGAGRTTVGSALAATLAADTQQPTVYTEYPTHQQLPNRFGFADDLTRYRHPAGYDIQLPQVDVSLPKLVDVTLFIDDLFNKYSNIIISLPNEMDDRIVYMVERATQIAFVVTPDQEAWAELEQLRAQLKPHIRPERTGLLTIINRPASALEAVKSPGRADFDLPYMTGLPALTDLGHTGAPLPEPLAHLTRAMADRLGRVHEVAVYIPTTIEVDQSLDTTPYVDSALAFLGEKFGGATGSQAQGVWDSDEAGLVSETVYIVRSFVTQGEIELHLNAVLDYVADLKTELKQEAMAVEVDQKFMLI